MNNISLPKRTILFVLITAAVLAISLIAMRFFPLSTRQSPVISAEAADLPVKEAAESAVQSFFQIDYREGKIAWIDRICANTTLLGCQIFSNKADTVWDQYIDAQTVTTATVCNAEKIADQKTEQVWRLTISLSESLPGSNKTEDVAYVLMIKTDTDWKFDRFLLESEIQAILDQPSKSTTIQMEG